MVILTWIAIMDLASKSRKDKVVIPPAKGYTCTDISLENAMRFVLGVETTD